jgi:hypothetical protein
LFYHLACTKLWPDLCIICQLSFPDEYIASQAPLRMPHGVLDPGALGYSSSPSTAQFLSFKCIIMHADDRASNKYQNLTESEECLSYQYCAGLDCAAITVSAQYSVTRFKHPASRPTTRHRNMHYDITHCTTHNKYSTLRLCVKTR